MSETIRKVVFSRPFAAAAGFTASMAAGALLTDSSMAGVASFADISLAGALPAQYTAAMLIGGILRSVAAGTVGRNIVKLTAVTIIFIAELFTDRTAKPVFAGFVTAGAVIASGTAVSVLTGELHHKLLFYLFYGALAGYTAYCASQVINDLRYDGMTDLTRRRGRDHAVLYIVIMSALCAAELPAVNAGVITGCGVSLLAAYFYHQTGGVICGAMTVCGAFLASPETGADMALLPAAAMLTGCIADRTPLVSAIVFTSLEMLLMVLTGISSDSFAYILDASCGAALFLVIAPYYSDRYVNAGKFNPEASRRLEEMRNVFLADTIDTVCAESGKAAELMDKRSPAGARCMKELKMVCSGCCREDICWDTARQMTVRGFRKLEKLPEVTKETFPYELTDCLRMEELTTAANRASRDRLTARLMKMRRREMQSILAEQMNMTGDMLRNSCRSPELRCSETVSRQIRNNLERHGIIANEVAGGYSSGGRLAAEIYLSADCQYESTRIRDLISDELGTELISCEELSSGKMRRIRLLEEPDFEVECYIASSCSSETGDNGDTTAFFDDGAGTSYTVLSDGMGNGTDAALESRMAVRLFRRLVCGGADTDTAIKLVNSIMFTKGSEEAFATLDTVRIDRSSGVMTISKSGAAATLICHEGSVMKITAPTFPIGIYTRSEAYTAEFRLSDGDSVIMFSDGIGENSYPFIKELLLSGLDIQRITDEICAKAELFNPTLRNDDVTVIGMRINRR